MSLESTIRMMTESKVVKEDGHTDVASAKRQCKTAMEDAQAIIGVLDGMNDEDALPTWWTNKLAIAANSMNKLNDYLSNPTEQKEEVELEEALPAHLAKLFDKKGNFKDPKKQKMYDDMIKKKAKPADVMRAMSRDVTPKGFGPNEEKEMTDVKEGRMKELAMYIDKGMTAQQIAKKMKLDVKTIQALMPKKEEVEMQDLDNLIEQALNEEVKYPHMMYDPETGEGVEAKTPEDHDKLAKKGYTHEKPIKEETMISEDNYKMERMGVSRSLVDSVKAVLSGKKIDREGIPDEITDEGVADFIGAASKAAADGKKEFKFGDKTYPVTIKKKTADKIAKKMEEAVKKEEDEEPADDETPSDEKKMKDKKDEKNGKKEPIEIDPEIKEEAEGEMTDAQMKKREEIVKELKKKEDEFKERYGDRYKEVMYATATKMAMKEAKK